MASKRVKKVHEVVGTRSEVMVHSRGRVLEVEWKLGEWITDSGLAVSDMVVGVDPSTGEVLTIHESMGAALRKAINRSVELKYAAIE